MLHPRPRPQLSQPGAGCTGSHLQPRLGLFPGLPLLTDGLCSPPFARPPLTLYYGSKSTQLRGFLSLAQEKLRPCPRGSRPCSTWPSSFRTCLTPGLPPPRPRWPPPSAKVASAPRLPQSLLPALPSPPTPRLGLTPSGLPQEQLWTETPRPSLPARVTVLAQITALATA